MVYDWLWKLGKNPLPQPIIPEGSKPDFVYTTGNKKIYIDVASVQESKKDTELSENQNFWPSQSTSSFATMRERFIDKAGRHKSIANAGNAYVICLGLESSFINVEDVKTCFIGNVAYNIPSGQIKAAMDGEIFETEDSGALLIKYKNVSAILVAQRHYSARKDINKLITLHI